MVDDLDLPWRLHIWSPSNKPTITPERDRCYYYSSSVKIVVILIWVSITISIGIFLDSSLLRVVILLSPLLGSESSTHFTHLRILPAAFFRLHFILTSFTLQPSSQRKHLRISFHFSLPFSTRVVTFIPFTTSQSRLFASPFVNFFHSSLPRIET